MNNKQLEEKLGLANGYINDIERGKNKNPSKLITALYEVLRISPNWVYSGEGSMFLTGQESQLPAAPQQKIPLLRQTVSCGPGQEWLDADTVEEYLEPLAMVPALKDAKVYAFRVRGVSMVGAGINDGDIVMFDGRPGQDLSDDVYVFALDGAVYCKLLKFDAISKKIEIYSVHTTELDKAELLRTLDTTQPEAAACFHLFGRVLALMRENRLMCR